MKARTCSHSPCICSQQCNPSSRGRPGTCLRPLVLAPLRASEGELMWRMAEQRRSQPSEIYAHPTAPFSLAHSSVIQLPGIPNTPGQSAPPTEPAHSERSRQVLSRICRDGCIPRCTTGTVAPSINGHLHKHPSSLRRRYCHRTQSWTSWCAVSNQY